ncbi:efflux RND transporter periplasmic adaptor subunit [Cognatiyoonia sp. IB215446]|uniref:efflux RND transporter periplasmic adaptor subunit n=1 Tax=Cognatiyoonia sp. IB215446 TaxID=3097355 RepID=UPI002A0C4243|nr:efflux RND transporter periplasmic adaptor subunit [Cognatiyoonia sp. IB215446]MDX8350255.1 efflux RND transporter periplasmic adaptor subunit [Cognatiyoonia sp. IB215446]
MPMQVSALIPATLAFCLLGSIVAAQEPMPDPVKEAPPLFVRTMVLGSASVTQERQFFGRIAALETADLSFEVPGYLAMLDAPRGTFVAKGEALAGLDLGPFARAVERAELSLLQAERDLGRLAELASRNVTSDVQAQDAETARDLAEVALRDAKEALADAQMRAPFDGIVADRMVSTFTNVAAGQPILRLHNMSEIRVEFDLPERLLTAVGDPAGVLFSAVLPGQTDPVPLIFREIAAETGSVGQSYTISLAVAGDLPVRVLPGKTVTVTARIARPNDIIPVPATAVITGPDGAASVVGLQEGDGGLLPEFIPVDVHSTTGVDLGISGVAPGTEIVALGGHLIGPDMPLARYAGLIVEGE